MKKILLATTTMMILGISENARAMDCPDLTSGNAKQFIDDAASGWETAYHSGYNSSYIFPNLGNKGTFTPAQVRHTKGGIECEYGFTYVTTLPLWGDKTWGPYGFILYKGPQKPDVTPTYIETAYHCYEGACHAIKMGSETHKAYVGKIEALVGLLSQIPENERIPEHKKILEDLEKLIAIEKEASLQKIVINTIAKGVSNSVSEAYETRSTLVLDILNTLKSIKGPGYAKVYESASKLFE